MSDHTINNATAVAGVVLGACVVEKHVTLDRSGGGVDDSFSLEPNELADLCRDAKIAWQSVGMVNYEVTEAEKGNIKFRRSLYVVRDVAEGELFTSSNVKSIRPGYGLSPRHFDDCLGKKASRAISRGTALTFDLIQS